MAKGTGGKAGRPKWMPGAAEIASIERLSGQGMSKTEICDFFSITDKTLTARLQDNPAFSEAYTRGRTKTVDKVTGWLMGVMENTDPKALSAKVQAIKFWLQHVAGWRERTELSGDKNKPVVVQEKGWKPTPKEKSEIIRIIKATFKPA